MIDVSEARVVLDSLLTYRYIMELNGDPRNLVVPENMKESLKVITEEYVQRRKILESLIERYTKLVS